MGLVPVRLRWSETRTGRPTCRSGRTAPAALVSTTVLQPDSTAARTEWQTDDGAWPS